MDDAGAGRPGAFADRAIDAPTAGLIVAHNMARRIAATVRATLAIPGVDLVLVVDDGSSDNTGELARKAGAVVVRHPHRRGRAVAIETGAAVIAMRDADGAEPRSLLLTEAGLGDAAIGAAPLVAAVAEGVADLAVALVDHSTKQQGLAANAARKAVAAVAGWSPLQPLSRVRCLTRAAFDQTVPLARGSGLDIAMTLDVLDAGGSVTEVPCDLRHRNPRPRANGLARMNQYRDVMVAISARRVRLSLRSTQGAVEDVFHIASAADRAAGRAKP